MEYEIEQSKPAHQALLFHRFYKHNHQEYHQCRGKDCKDKKFPGVKQSGNEIVSQIGSQGDNVAHQIKLQHINIIATAAHYLRQ